MAEGVEQKQQKTTGEMNITTKVKTPGDLLCEAAENGEVDQIRQAIEKKDVPIDSTDTIRFSTPLMRALSKTTSKQGPHYEVVRYLIELAKQHANLFATDNLGWSPLLWACYGANGNFQPIWYLLERARIAGHLEHTHTVVANSGKNGPGDERKKAANDTVKRMLRHKSATGYTCLMLAVEYYPRRAERKKKKKMLGTIQAPNSKRIREGSNRII